MPLCEENLPSLCEADIMGMDFVDFNMQIEEEFDIEVTDSV